MLKALLKVRLAAFGAYYTGASRSRKRQSAAQKLGFAALLAYCVGVFAVLFYNSFSALAGVYAALGLDWLYFAMYAVMALALMVFGSVFTAKAQLFEAKDNELLLSMPIPPRDILASRMIALLGLNFVFELIVAVPVLLAWLQAAKMTALGLVSFLLLLLALPCLAMAVTSLLAWLLSLLASRVRRKALVTMIGSVLFLGVYFAVVFRMNRYMTILTQSGAEIAGKLSGAHALVWLGKAMAGEDAQNLLFSLLVTLAPFAAMYAVLSRSFLSIVTTRRGLAKVRYREKALRPVRCETALLRRELQRLGASATYLLNAGMGLLLLLAAAAALVIKREAVLNAFEQLPELRTSLPVFLMLAIGSMTSMTLFTPSAVSLEGKSLWILQSMPVTGYQALQAKRCMANCLTLPAAAIAGICCAAVTDEWWTITLANLCFALFTNDFGLREGIVHARLDWTNEAQPVKQGWAVMLAMFAGWGMLLAAGALWLMWGAEALSARAFILGFGAVMLALDTWICHWLRTSGAERFSHLS